MRLLPTGYVSKDTEEIKQLGNFLLKILFGNMDTLVCTFECKGTWTLLLTFVLGLIKILSKVQTHTNILFILISDM